MLTIFILNLYHTAQCSRCYFINYKSGAAEACWAHNPEVRESIASAANVIVNI